VAVGAAIAVASFVVRLWFPIDTIQTLNLHLWEWPQCLAMFLFGVACARRGWLGPVPPRIARGCGIVAIVAAVSTPILILSADPLGLDEEVYWRVRWPRSRRPSSRALSSARALGPCLRSGG
jgi:hypothetical protein